MRRWERSFFLALLLIGVVLSGYSEDNPTAAQDQQGQTAAQAAQDKSDKHTSAESGRKTHVRLGTISVGASYTHFSGPFYGYPWYPYGYGYSPVLWSPFWSYYGPLYYPPYFSPGNGRGAVKLDADPKSAQVFIDNAYAGTVAKLKSFWLDPGAYDLAVTAEGRAPYRQRIYVLSGRTLRIKAALQPESGEVAP